MPRTPLLSPRDLVAARLAGSVKAPLVPANLLFALPVRAVLPFTSPPATPAIPPGGGATRGVSETLEVREGDDDDEVRGIRLGSDELPIEGPFPPLGGETRAPSLTLPPELPLAVPDEPPDDELLDEVPPRGPACAHAATGTASVNTTAIDPNARIDLVMASAPRRQP